MRSHTRFFLNARFYTCYLRRAVRRRPRCRFAVEPRRHQLARQWAKLGMLYLGRGVWLDRLTGVRYGTSRYQEW